MSIEIATEIMNRLRTAGITVHEQSGWQSRGNGQTSAYEGLIIHHTATAQANINLTVLIDGRPDLMGPLCNTCGWADGSVGLISANPANHAGASGGYNTLPLPITSNFNKLVWGHEIIYPGTSPMTTEQYKTATVLAKICTDLFGFRDINRAKGHAETSITGKWDPGYALGKTIDLNKFRTDAKNVVINPIVNKKGELMGTKPDTLKQSNDWVNLNFPVESHTSAVPGDMYFTISSGFGDTEYHLIIADGKGQFLDQVSGSQGQGNWGKEVTVASDRRHWHRLPATASIVSLRYRNLGSSVAGYAFPYMSQ